MNRLREIWQILLGRVSVEDLRKRLMMAEIAVMNRYDEVQELKRKMEFARVALKELQARLPSEAQLRAESDALGEAVIKDMKDNPRKYLP